MESTVFCPSMHHSNIILFESLPVRLIARADLRSRRTPASYIRLTFFFKQHEKASA